MPRAWHSLSAHRALPRGHRPPPGTWAGGPLLSILAGADVGSDADATPAAKGAEGWEENGGEGRDGGPSLPQPREGAPAGEDVWGPGTGTYEGCSAHCPWRAPSLGSSHSRTPRGRRGGPAGVCKRGESTFHVLMRLQRGERLPSQSVGQSVNKQLSGPAGEATGSFQRERTRQPVRRQQRPSLCPTDTCPVSTAAWPGERASPGRSAAEGSGSGWRAAGLAASGPCSDSPGHPSWDPGLCSRHLLSQGPFLAPLPCFIRLHDTPSLGHKIAY